MVLLRKILVKLPFGDPEVVAVVVDRVIKVEVRQSTVVVGTEKVSAHSLEASVLGVFLLCDCEVTKGVHHREVACKLNLPGLT